MIQNNVINRIKSGAGLVIFGACFAMSVSACQFHEPKKRQQDTYQKELYSRSGKGSRWSHNRKCWYEGLEGAVTFFENTGKVLTFVESLERLPNSLANQCVNDDGLTLLTRALSAGCLDKVEGVLLVQSLLQSGARLFGPCSQAFYLGRGTPFYQVQKNLTSFLQEIDSDSDYLRNWRDPVTGGTLLHLYARCGNDLQQTYYSLFEDIYFLMDRLKIDPLVRNNDGKTYQDYVAERGLLNNQPLMAAVAIKTLQKRNRTSGSVTTHRYDPSVIEPRTGKILQSCVFGPAKKIETYRPLSPVLDVQSVSSHKRQKSVIEDNFHTPEPIPAGIRVEVPAYQAGPTRSLFPDSPGSDTSQESDLLGIDSDYDARVSSILDTTSQVIDSEDEFLSSLPDLSDFEFDNMALSVIPGSSFEEDDNFFVSGNSQSPPPLKISNNFFKNEARTPESNPAMFMADRRQNQLIPRSLWPEGGEVA